MKLFPGQTLDDIGDDEPVLVIRAADAEAPAIIRKAAFLYRARHGASSYAADLEAFADEVFEWQHADGNAAPPPPADVDDQADELEADPTPAKRSKRSASTSSSARPDVATRKERRR